MVDEEINKSFDEAEKMSFLDSILVENSKEDIETESTKIEAENPETSKEKQEKQEIIQEKRENTIIILTALSAFVFYLLCFALGVHYFILLVGSFAFLVYIVKTNFKLLSSNFNFLGQEEIQRNSDFNQTEDQEYLQTLLHI